MKTVMAVLLLLAGCSGGPQALPMMYDDDAAVVADAAADAGLEEDLGADAGQLEVDAGADLGQPDLGTDAGQDLGVDLGLDAGEPDLGTIDAGIDLGADLGTDLGQPDLGPSCDAVYSGAYGYRFCAERSTECEFYAVLGGMTGNARCTLLGGTCISTYDSNPSSGDACLHGAWLGCGRSLPADAVVVCSR